MDYRILGPLEVHDGERPVAVGGDKQRALLAILLLHRNEAVSAELLIEELWGGSPPASALRTLHAYLSRLRKALNANGRFPEDASGNPGPGRADGPLVTRGHGYLLRVAAAELDLGRFLELADRGRAALAAGQPEQASSLLREALTLWRGRPLEDFTYEPFAQASIAQLEELRLGALEERIRADLALGHAPDLISELRDLVGRNPLREGLCQQLMLALYRCGRQAEALELYQQYRRTLSEQLGLEPGRGLQQLEIAILRRDPSLDIPAAATTPDAPPATAPVPPSAGPRGHRHRLAMGGAVLVALALVGGIVASTGGGVARSASIPGDAVGAMSPSAGAIRAVVPLGTTPSALATGDGAVWVANYNAGAVSRIDSATRDVVETIPVGTSPAGLAVGANAVWVTNYYGGTVSRIDPIVDRIVQTIPVGNAPNGVAVGDGSVWVANSSDGTLSRINAVSGNVVTTIALGSGATDVTTGAGAVWVSDEAGNRVYRVDPQSDQVTQFINVGTGPTAIAVALGSVWVANSLDGTVSRIDPTTNAVTATIPVGDGAGAIAVGDGAIWVTSQYAGTVSQIDPATDAVTRTVRTGNRPNGLTLAGGLVWLGVGPANTSHRGGTLRVVTSGYADTMDPVLTQNLLGLLPLTYDGLTAYQRVGGSGSTQLVPDLAVSLPSSTDGGTTYTFQLRRGVRFSNGELVRPEDFRRALERDLILGGNSSYGGPFANVVGGAQCAARPSHCDLSRGVLTDDAANTVTFHLVTPNPEFLERLTLLDAVAVPAGTPLHDVGLHPLPATGPYEWIDVSRNAGTLVRNPYFHEWSHAARPDGYLDRIVFRHTDTSGLTAVESGSADYNWDGVPGDRLGEVQTRFAGRLYITPISYTLALFLNTRKTPFSDVRVRRAINYAIDRAKIVQMLGAGDRPACQVLPVGLPGYRRYCPYTVDPGPTGAWHAPDLPRAEQLLAAAGTRGTPITISNVDYWTFFDINNAALDTYLVSLLDRLGYPTRVRDSSAGTVPNAPARFADSRTNVQAAIFAIPLGLQYPSASQVLQANFDCQSFVPDSTGNPNWSEFCDRQLDAQINRALAAESNNSPDTASYWAQADRTATDQAPVVPLATGSYAQLVSARVGNYQYSFQQGVLVDQLWVR